MRTTAHLAHTRRVDKALVNTKCRKLRRIAWRGVLKRCRAGERLHQTYDGTQTAFIMEPSDIRVPPRHARLAIEIGKLISLNDGLFEFSSQTWIAKERR
jgi:hypothetical protein